MKELRGDLFIPTSYNYITEDGKLRKFYASPDAICITTNGFVKRNREAVMGRGCALEAAKRIPELPSLLGHRIQLDGLEVTRLTEVAVSINTLEEPIHHPLEIVAFPVKPAGIKINHEHHLRWVVKHMRNKFKVGDSVPGWACIADKELIERSAEQLDAMADEQNWNTVILPRPGCGAGELKWEDIKPILEEVLDDRFFVITY